MKATILIFTFVSIGLFSCKKKDISASNACIIPPNPKMEAITTPYFPLKVGAYWVYETYKIDENGLETNTGVSDTIRITGDTTIHNKKFYKYTTKLQGAIPYTNLLRDSSGFIVNQNGVIVYNFQNFSATTQVDPYMSTWQSTNQLIDFTSTPITVPAGTFQTMNLQRTLSNIDGTPIDTCGNMTFKVQNHYGLNVGAVKWCSAYYNDIPVCKNRETRLVEYYIP